MTQVDFYLARGDGNADRELTVCKLTQKAFRLGHQIYIHTASPEESAHLDRLLWTFSAGSFVPHALLTDDRQPEVPVLIGEQDPPEQSQDVLICLTAAAPSFFERFERVVDVVGPTAEARERARERFRFYRDRGYTVQTHNL